MPASLQDLGQELPADGWRIRWFGTLEGIDRFFRQSSAEQPQRPDAAAAVRNPSRGNQRKALDLLGRHCPPAFRGLCTGCPGSPSLAPLSSCGAGRHGHVKWRYRLSQLARRSNRSSSATRSWDTTSSLPPPRALLHDEKPGRRASMGDGGFWTGLTTGVANHVLQQGRGGPRHPEERICFRNRASAHPLLTGTNSRNQARSGPRTRSARCRGEWIEKLVGSYRVWPNDFRC